MQQAEKEKLNNLVLEVGQLTQTLNNFMRNSSNYDTGVSKDVAQIQKDITEIKLLITQNYVRREEFTPVQKIVYGLVSVVLLTVLGGLLAFVIKK